MVLAIIVVGAISHNRSVNDLSSFVQNRLERSGSMSGDCMELSKFLKTMGSFLQWAEAMPSELQKMIFRDNAVDGFQCPSVKTTHYTAALLVVRDKLQLLLLEDEMLKLEEKDKNEGLSEEETNRYYTLREEEETCRERLRGLRKVGNTYTRQHVEAEEMLSRVLNFALKETISVLLGLRLQITGSGVLVSNRMYRNFLEVFAKTSPDGNVDCLDGWEDLENEKQRIDFLEERLATYSKWLELIRGVSCAHGRQSVVLDGCETPRSMMCPDLMMSDHIQCNRKDTFWTDLNNDVCCHGQPVTLKELAKTAASKILTHSFKATITKAAKTLGVEKVFTAGKKVIELIKKFRAGLKEKWQCGTGFLLDWWIVRPFFIADPTDNYYDLVRAFDGSYLLLNGLYISIGAIDNGEEKQQFKTFLKKEAIEKATAWLGSQAKDYFKESDKDS